MTESRIAYRSAELVGVESVTGQEKDAIELVRSWLEPVADELDVWVSEMTELEDDPDYPGREVQREEVPVVAARITGNRPGPTLVLTGHVDTVPVGDRDLWERNPAGEIDGDILYGRGAADMKAGMVAAVEAFTVIAESQRSFPGEVRLVAVSGEEDGGTGTLAAIRRGWVGDYVIVVEPTSGPRGPEIVVAHAGALTFSIVVEGRAAHAAVRREGESALDRFLPVHQALSDLEVELNEAETSDMMQALGLPYPTAIGTIQGGTWASNVMEKITAEIRVGVTVDESTAQAEHRFERTLRSALAGDPWLDAHPPIVERTGAAFGSSSIAIDHPLVDAVGDAATAATGVAPRRIAVPYGCDMALWTRVAGAATLVYGPGDVRLAHAVDERVSMNETELVADVLVDAVQRMQRASD